MKNLSLYSVVISAVALLQQGSFGFVVNPTTSASLATTMATTKTTTQLRMAKYNSMDEILDLFPEEMPILINFYDAATENDIKDDIFRVKELLKDRASVCSIKQQDYPEL